MRSSRLPNGTQDPNVAYVVHASNSRSAAAGCDHRASRPPFVVAVVLLVLTGAGWVGARPVLAAPALVAEHGAASAQKSASPLPSGAVKFYIVGDPGEGQREFLFDIANETLGDGKRYLEIFELNKGRLQPGGQRMSDPTMLAPGWILQLPDDAQGQDVQIGPLPMVAITASSVHGPTPAAATPLPVEPPGLPGAVIQIVVLIATVTLLGFVVRLLRRPRRLALLPRRSLATAVAPSGPIPRNADNLGWQQPPAPAPPRVDLSPSALTPTMQDPLRTAPPLPRRPTGSSHTGGAYVEATVTAGANTVAVKLVGVRAPIGTRFAWHGRPGSRPVVESAVAVGDGERGTLFVDLALSPDIITLVGEAVAVLRQARSMARQLDIAGVYVTIVGDLLGAPAVAPHTVASLGDLADLPPGPALRVVFAGAVSPDELPMVQRLLAQLQPRTVVVLVGAGPRARWSLQVVESAAQPSAAPASARVVAPVAGSFPGDVDAAPSIQLAQDVRHMSFDRSA
jgi:hypothetical protein